MKKSLLALGAACIALSGMAASPMQKLPAPAAKSFDRTVELKTSDNRIAKRHPSPMKKAPAKVSEADVVTEVEGIRQNNVTTASGYFTDGYNIYIYEDMTMASHVVYGENGEIYFYDIIPNGGMESYVKGVKTDDKVEISLPQTAWYSDDYGYGLKLCLLKLIDPGDEETLPVYEVTEDESVTFAVAEDGTMVAEGLSEDLMLGYAYTDDNSFIYTGVFEMSIAPFGKEIVELPEDYTVSEGYWVAKNIDYGYFVNWAQGYDEVYFQGICEAMPEAWVKGTVEYDDYQAVISIAQDQVPGDCYGYYIYTKAAKCIYDEDGELVDFELLPADTPYQLIWDFEENTITPKDKDIVLIFNAAEDEIYYLQLFMDLNLIHQDEFDGTPANPCNLKFADYYADYGFGIFMMNIPNLSTEGDVLDPNSLYYVVYVDGEEWEFDAEENDIPETLVEIPWKFDAGNIYSYGGAEHEVYFEIEGISTLGVQSIYKYNGEETRSEIVTISLDEDAVDAVNADKKIAGVKFFDVAGREVSKAAKGVVIKRVVYEDGTVASFKKMAR